MNVPDMVALFITFSNRFVPLGLTVILQSTIIIISGLLVLKFLRERHSSLQSAVLRAILIVIIVSPLVTVLFIRLRINRLQVPLPVKTETVKRQQSRKKSTEAPKQLPRVTNNVRSGDMMTKKSSNVKTVVENVPGHQQKGSTTDTLHKTKPSQVNEHYSQVYPPPQIKTEAGQDSKKNEAIHFPGTIADIQVLLYCVFTATWIIASLFYLLKSLIVALCIAYIRHTGYTAKKSYQSLCKDTASILGMSAPSVLQHPVVKGAFVCGFIKPAIVIPYNHREKDLATREVFLHELAHLARHDNLWNLVCQVAIILLPVQPLISTFIKRLSYINEFACDDYVIAHGGNKRSYAIQLFNISKAYHPGIPEATIGTGIISSPSPILERIERILDTSYIRIIKVKAFEVLSVIVFSLSSLTLSGFVGFKGNHANGKRPISPAVKQHIERIITHIPDERPHQQTIQIGSSLELVQQPNTYEDNSTKEDTITATMNTERLDEKRDDSGTSEFADSGDVSTPETTAREMTNLITHNPGAERIAELSAPDSEPVTAHYTVQDQDTTTKPQTESVATGDNVPDSEAAPTTVSADSLFMTNSHQTSFASYVMRDNDRPAPVPLPVEITYNYSDADRGNPEESKWGDIYQAADRNQKCPIWSPVGSWIAYSDPKYGIWMVPTDGGEPQLVYDNYQNIRVGKYNFMHAGLETLSFSPNGKEIAFTLEVFDREADFDFDSLYDSRLNNTSITEYAPVYLIASVNVDTGEKRIIAEDTKSGSWSRDGRYFTYSKHSSPELHVIDLNTGEDHILIHETALSPCFSADNRSIFFSGETSDSTTELFSIPTGGGTPKQLTFHENDSPVEARIVTDCSPNGEWVLYTGSMSDHSFLGAFNTLTGSHRELFPDEPFSLRSGKFSSDGNQICFYLSTTDKLGPVQKLYIGKFALPSDVQDITEQETGTEPESLSLTGNFPNPFNASTTIEFSIPSDGFVRLAVYNILGQKVRELSAGDMAQGTHTMVWNGRDDNGMTVSNGTYISHLQLGNHTTTRRMMLLK
ncbi:M56 family metallopeptidase [Candidatus Latescibacterota bacterium]